MGNRERGEVTFHAAGESYTLRFSENALCLLEEELDRGVVGILREMSSWATDQDAIRLTTLRAVMWAGLQEHHPKSDLKQAGALIGDVGGIVAAANIVADALRAAFPEEGTTTERPTKAPGIRGANRARAN